MRHVPIMFKPEMLEQVMAGKKIQTMRTGKQRWWEGDLLWVKERTPGQPNKMFMPKRLTKTWLRVTKPVYYMNVQHITQQMVTDEGFSSRSAFMCLWDRMYGKTDMRWSNDPWVWVIVFELCKAPRNCE